MGNTYSDWKRFVTFRPGDLVLRISTEGLYRVLEDPGGERGLLVEQAGISKARSYVQPQMLRHVDHLDGVRFGKGDEVVLLSPSEDAEAGSIHTVVMHERSWMTVIRDDDNRRRVVSRTTLHKLPSDARSTPVTQTEEQVNDTPPEPQEYADWERLVTFKKGDRVFKIFDKEKEIYEVRHVVDGTRVIARDECLSLGVDLPVLYFRHLGDAEGVDLNIGDHAIVLAAPQDSLTIPPGTIVEVVHLDCVAVRVRFLNHPLYTIHHRFLHKVPAPVKIEPTDARQDETIATCQIGTWDRQTFASIPAKKTWSDILDFQAGESVVTRDGSEHRVVESEGCFVRVEDRTNSRFRAHRGHFRRKREDFGTTPIRRGDRVKCLIDSVDPVSKNSTLLADVDYTVKQVRGEDLIISGSHHRDRFAFVSAMEPRWTEELDFKVGETVYVVGSDQSGVVQDFDCEWQPCVLTAGTLKAYARHLLRRVPTEIPRFKAGDRVICLDSDDSFRQMHGRKWEVAWATEEQVDLGLFRTMAITRFKLAQEADSPSVGSEKAAAGQLTDMVDENPNKARFASNLLVWSGLTAIAAAIYSAINFVSR